MNKNNTQNCPLTYEMLQKQDECPECNAKMEVPKLNKIQDVKCQVCGLSGEIEI